MSAFDRLWRAVCLLGVLVAGATSHAQSNVELGKLGWYADPEAHVFAGQYWIYPTSSDPGTTPRQ